MTCLKCCRKLLSKSFPAVHKLGRFTFIFSIVGRYRFDTGESCNRLTKISMSGNMLQFIYQPIDLFPVIPPNCHCLVPFSQSSSYPFLSTKLSLRKSN